MDKQIEKQKKTMFNVCINDLKSKCSKSRPLYPEVLCKDIGRVVQEIKMKKEEILQQTPLYSLRAEDVDRFSQALWDTIISESLDCARRSFSEEEKYLGILDETLKKFALLRERIQSRYNLIKNQYAGKKRYESWRGADVIVTSENTFIQKKSVDLSGGKHLMLLSSSGDADVVVVTDNPYPIVWMLYSLRNNSKGYIDFRNKYEFYGRVAEAAKLFLEKKPDQKNDRQLLLACLSEAESIVMEKKKTLLKIKNDFDRYYETRRIY